MCFVITHNTEIEIIESRKTFSVKFIFEDNDNWLNYKAKFPVRGVELKEVENMLSCKGTQRGYFLFHCGNCGKELIVPFGCNSKLCSCCGKRYVDRWAEKLSNKLITDLTYKHITLTLPEILWKYIKENRKLQKVIMDTASKTIKDLLSYSLKQEVTPGIILVLHPFGRDLKFKPHVHALITEGGYNSQNKFVKLGNYICYQVFHKKWQYHLLSALKGLVPSAVIDKCYIQYPQGFVAHIRPERIGHGQGLIRYVGRYIRHPAIANSRIIDYNGRDVTFCYDDNKGKRMLKTMGVFEFISSIIQHLPERNFRMIRYYGIYSRNNIQRYTKVGIQSAIDGKILKKSKEDTIVYCPCCYEKMEFVIYVKPPPKKDMSLIVNWIS